MLKSVRPMPLALRMDGLAPRATATLGPADVKLGSKPLSEVIWVKPPPVIGTVAMPVLFSKTTVWPFGDTEGRSLAAPHTADGQNTLTTPVLGLSVSRSPVAESWKTTGPLVPGNAA